jgi:hypothetical protein
MGYVFQPIKKRLGLAGNAPNLERMNAQGIILRPVPRGWVIELTDGREVVRFTGLRARRRAFGYLASHDVAKAATRSRSKS